MITNRINENQNLLSLWLVSFLVGLRNYQHPSTQISRFMKNLLLAANMFYVDEQTYRHCEVIRNFANTANKTCFLSIPVNSGSTIYPENKLNVINLLGGLNFKFFNLLPWSNI